MEQLQREHTELEKLERIRKDFVINVSHELRTPLASIQGYTETLIDGAHRRSRTTTCASWAIIRHNAERLARLTEDLLTLSRIEQKRQKFEFEMHFGRTRCFAKRSNWCGRSPRRAGSAWRLEPAPEDAVVWCDSEAVSQVLSNLLDNAIKYTPAGGTITVGAQSARADSWNCSCATRAIGIPAEDLPRLFERFYRVDKARSRELGGTGLGLSIVKHLVAAHNGTMRVESRVNQGPTFFFTLAGGSRRRRRSTA